MREIEVQRREWTPSDRKQQAPDMDNMIDEDVKLFDRDTRKIIAVQVKLAEHGPSAVARHMLAGHLRRGIRWDDSGGKGTSQARLNGMRYGSRVFGFTEAKPLRKRYGCSSSMFSSEYPKLTGLLDNITTELWAALQREQPDAAKHHEELVRGDVNSDWLINGCPWTSGIINNTAALPYHRDSGNIASSWSAMLSLRNRVGGGGLYLPEYDVALAVPNNSVIMFDGQGAWHGVTPFRMSRADGYRFTLVWYAKQGFVGVGSAADEAKRAADYATRLNDEKAAGNA